MKTRIGAAAALALFAALSCFSDRTSIIEPDGADCTIPASAFGRNRAVVIIRDFTFFSDTVRIRAGGTVTWVNCEDPGVPDHTSTSTSDVWDSPDLPPGSSFPHTFDSTGTFPYFCRPHTFMRGVVIVQ
jgi:plastocyanin